MVLHGFSGILHTAAATLAIIAGTYVLYTTKGTRAHKKSGYIYGVSMAVMLISSFFIYRVYQSFGLFHILALVSAATLSLGMIPMWLTTRTGRRLEMHFRFMYWSVVGLYAAFAAELFVRIPAIYHFFSKTHQERIFHSIVTGSSLLIVAIGLVLFRSKKKTWAVQIRKLNHKSKPMP